MGASTQSKYFVNSTKHPTKKDMGRKIFIPNIRHNIIPIVRCYACKCGLHNMNMIVCIFYIYTIKSNLQEIIVNFELELGRGRTNADRLYHKL